jgi:ankyrin repeat protein
MAGRDLTSDNDIAEINLPDRRIIASLACLPCDRSIQHAHLSNVIRNAIAKGYLGLVRALLESPLAADQSLLSPDMLLTVIQCPTFGPRATSNDDRAAIAQVLLNSGSNPNAIAEATGESALHIAIRNGYSATVGVLVDASTYPEGIAWIKV